MCANPKFSNRITQLLDRPVTGSPSYSRSQLEARAEAGLPGKCGRWDALDDGMFWMAGMLVGGWDACGNFDLGPKRERAGRVFREY